MVKDGQVMGFPKLISPNPSDSPNTDWKLEQMKLNGFLPCDLSCDPLNEYIDYTSPIVLDDLVKYPALKLSTQSRIDVQNQNILLKREVEYPSTKDLTVAIWELVVEGRPESSNALQQLRLQVKAKYPKVTT